MKVMYENKRNELSICEYIIAAIKEWEKCRRISRVEIEHILNQMIDNVLTNCMLDDAGHHNLDDGEKPKLIKYIVDRIIEVAKR